MDDLIYKFLLQAGFPRAAIVTDVQSVVASAAAHDASFVIVDPDTTDRLAAIQVVGPANAELLIEQAALMAQTCSALDGQQTQGFIVRVDTRAKKEEERVQFYRCHPNADLQQLSAQTFPDLGSLKVHHKLTATKLPVQPEIIGLLETEAPRKWASEPTYPQFCY